MNCNLIAPWYEFLERVSFGRALDRRRTAFIGELGKSDRAILCGEGDGRFMAALLRSDPTVEVTAFDASTAMVRVAHRRIARMGPSYSERMDLHAAELTVFDSVQDQYDLIATHFFLDCFPTSEVGHVVQKIAEWAAPRAKWLVSEFHQPPSRLGRAWTGAIIRSLYAGFRVTTGLKTKQIPNYRPALAEAGFELQRQEQACGGLLVSELWERNH